MLHLSKFSSTIPFFSTDSYYPISTTSSLAYQTDTYWNSNGTSLATPSLSHTIQAPPSFNGYPTPPSDSNRNGGITDDKSIYKSNGYYYLNY